MIKEKNACLLIHGFTGGPFEVMPLAEHLISKGHEVMVPTLAGHGEKLKELGQVTYLDWIASAEAKLIELSATHQRVSIIGFSMGGLIGIHLARKYNIDTLVTLSTPIYVLDLKKIVKNLCTGLKNKDYRRIGKYAFNIAQTPLKAVLNFRQLLTETKPLIKDINIPVLVIQGLRDDTVRPKSAEYIYKNVSTDKRQIYYLPDSAHLICCDVEKEQVFNLVNDFLDLHE